MIRKIGIAFFATGLALVAIGVVLSLYEDHRIAEARL